MKKLITLFLITGFSAVSMAQTSAQQADGPPIKSDRPEAPSASSDGLKATPFWTETFAGGFPAGWQVLDSSGICPWVWSDDGSWGYWNGNNAASAAAGINSTTAGDGFLICDPDSANHFNYGQPSGTTYQYLSSYFQTDAIDCSGRASVILNFEQYYRYNNGVPMYVKVSNDGTNWTSFDVSNGLANNTASTNPVTQTVNITSVAANQATVYLQFGWSARVYHWQIDDITLSEADPFDVALNDAWWGQNNLNYQYYKIPMSHTTPITFYGDIANNTGGTLNGCSSTVDVATEYSGMTNSIAVAAADHDTVTSTTTWTPANEGLFMVDFSASTTDGTDANPGNNDFQDSIMITNSIFGLDNLTDPSQSTNGIQNFSSNTGGAFKIGNLYQVTNDDQIECVHIGISDQAQNDGKIIFAEVYAYNPSTGDFDFRGTSGDYTIQSGDLGTIVNLMMDLPGDVFQGEEVLVVAGHYGGDPSGSDDVNFMYGQPVPDQMVWGYNAAGDLFWLSSPRAIVVRADFSCGLNVSETDGFNMEVYPNPFNDELNLTWEATSEMNVQIVDIAGRVVYDQTLNGGSQTIATDNMSEGMYTIILSDGNTVNSDKVVLNR